MKSIVKKSSESLAVISPVSPMAAPLGRHTAHGAFWTILFSLLNKVAALGSQIALAWFLLPSDFGLVGMALSITSMAALVSGMNLKNVLIQRQDRFDQDVGQVFWLSLLMGLTGTMLLVAAAPVAGIIFKDHRVVPLILVVAISIFLGSMPAIYAAALSRDLRFRTVAMIQFGVGMINNVGAVLLAAMHFGAYSLVVPITFSSLFALLAHRIVVGRIQIPAPKPSEWALLLRPVSLIMCYSLLIAILSYGANFVIGLLHNSTVTGFYFWGFSIASQAVFLLAGNLRDLLFPALTKLNLEPKRQFEAFRKACLVLTIITVPVCVLQILLAKPVIGLIFHERWLPAAGVVQGLSFGLMTQAISILATSLFLARGEYGRLCQVTGISMILTILATVVGAMLGEQVAVAYAVGLVSLISNLIAGRFALGSLGYGWRQLGDLIIVPLGLTVPILALCFYLNHLVFRFGATPQIAIVGFSSLLTYAVAACLLLPELRTHLKLSRLVRW